MSVLKRSVYVNTACVHTCTSQIYRTLNYYTVNIKDVVPLNSTM